MMSNQACDIVESKYNEGAKIKPHETQGKDIFGL